MIFVEVASVWGWVGQSPHEQLYEPHTQRYLLSLSLCEDKLAIYEPVIDCVGIPILCLQLLEL